MIPEDNTQEILIIEQPSKEAVLADINDEPAPIPTASKKNDKLPDRIIMVG